MGKIIRQIQKTVTDEDGIVLKEEIEKESFLEKEPDFIKVYLEDLSYLKNLPKWTNRILYEILSFMNYENEIILTSYLKDKIARKLDINGQKTIDNSISEFVKTGVLIREARSVFKANPMYFGKGSWSNIKKIRLEISYKEGVREFEANIQKSEE